MRFPSGAMSQWIPANWRRALLGSGSGTVRNIFHVIVTFFPPDRRMIYTGKVPSPRRVALLEPSRCKAIAYLRSCCLFDPLPSRVGTTFLGFKDSL
jgi:hypothetical protein